ncbi:MAG: AAA family ATPase, partial [Lachnospiraceae bacterium]|nr:AAA family ATPase [Lachnospiraceae bacterium]
IDEYDVLVREQVSQDLFDRYLSFLNGLFKSDTLRPAISLAYLTGILPIVRDKVQSKLNNFREYTVLDAGEFSEYIGFTSDEVQELCDKYGISFDECRNWYDGYSLDEIEIYNPESLVMAVTRGKFKNYWSKTSSYQAIIDRIQTNYKGMKDDVIKMFSGESVDVDAGMYLNTMTDFSTKDEIFTYLIHLGYLAYDQDNESCRIPNREVRDEWARAVSKVSEYEVTDEIIKASKELLKETLSGNEEAVAAALDKSHIHVSSNRSYNNEDVLQSAIYLAYIYALNDYECFREVTAGKGFADMVYIPIKSDKPALIIELKHNKTVESALDQIRDKKYFECLKHYQGDMLLIGINYDEKDKTHECRIEKEVM